MSQPYASTPNILATPRDFSSPPPQNQNPLHSNEGAIVQLGERQGSCDINPSNSTNQKTIRKGLSFCRVLATDWGAS